MAATSILTLSILALSVENTFGSDISNISLAVDVSNTYLTAGLISLIYRGERPHICYYGDHKTWGKRGSDTACKQLKFAGGWPYDIDTGKYISHTHNLNNFDCDEGATDLNLCKYDVTNMTKECDDFKLAGIQCYSSFEVQLVGGVSSNAGRVEVRYDDAWSSVCYAHDGSTDASSNGSPTPTDWSFANAQMVCRELGFPGTMFARQGGYGYGIKDTFINGYNCKEDLSETSLQYCYPDTPKPVQNESDASCSFGTFGGNNEAVAICAVPGYVGCYNREMDHMDIESITLPSMTINVCRRHCRKLVYRYALLQNGDTCLCAGVVPRHRLGDTSCKTQCSGDDNAVCGDKVTLSVYDVTIGVCSDPLNKTDVYYFGDIIRTFECRQGMERVNTSAIQCVIGTSVNGYGWNDTSIPDCKEKAGKGDGANIEKEIRVIQTPALSVSQKNTKGMQ
ncbi:uncharacterized protein [Amphiura filiformis]|uniref:uncharacterized protein isoform X2 n=1 Tax=Amphiura filiformis TaxID=82378 RepID=UPI003B227D67